MFGGTATLSKHVTQLNLLVFLAWDSAKADSNELEILNQPLRWRNADFAESMLQFAKLDFEGAQLFCFLSWKTWRP